MMTSYSIQSFSVKTHTLYYKATLCILNHRYNMKGLDICQARCESQFKIKH